MAKWAAIRYTANHIFSYIELNEQYAIVEVAVPESWLNRSVGELNIRKKYGINILGIKKDGKTNMTVTPETLLTDDMTILALGEYPLLRKCFCL